MIVWDEPYSNDPLTNVECRMTREDVIKYQRAKYPYETDQHAVDDFITVHWARELKD